MNVTIDFDKDVLATAIADIVDEEKQRPCEIHEKLRRFVKDGTSDLDVKWVIDVITEAAAKAVEIG
jgi:hypothetical protein